MNTKKRVFDENLVNVEPVLLSPIKENLNPKSPAAKFKGVQTASFITSSPNSIKTDILRESEYFQQITQSCRPRKRA